MVKQYRSDGTEIREGESAVPGYVPFHLRDAQSASFAEGEGPAPVCGDPDPDSWLEAPPAELLNAKDPGEAPSTPVLTPSQATDNNIDRIYQLITSPLCHDYNYRPLRPKEQLHILSLVMTRILWKDVPDV